MPGPTLIEVSSIQENRVRRLRHDLILLVSESRHPAIAVVLRAAPRGVDIDLLEVGVDVIDVDHRQVINISTLPSRQAVSFPEGKE